MQLETASALIDARTKGVFDDPGLLAFGPLGDTAGDITEIKRRYLVAEGFTVGVRDPRLNRDYPGAFMCVEAHEESELPTRDGSNGPWCVVGDDLSELIGEAFDFAASL